MGLEDNSWTRPIRGSTVNPKPKALNTLSLLSTPELPEALNAEIPKPPNDRKSPELTQQCIMLHLRY